MARIPEDVDVCRKIIAKENRISRTQHWVSESVNIDCRLTRFILAIISDSFDTVS